MDILSTYRYFLSEGTDSGAAASLTIAQVIHHEHEGLKGNITVAQGTHALTIQTGFPPEKIYLWLNPTEVAGCGTAGVNLAGAVMDDEGFTIYANIQTNTCTINYLVY